MSHAVSATLALRPPCPLHPTRPFAPFDPGASGAGLEALEERVCLSVASPLVDAPAPADILPPPGTAAEVVGRLAPGALSLTQSFDSFLLDARARAIPQEPFRPIAFLFFDIQAQAFSVARHAIPGNPIIPGNPVIPTDPITPVDPITPGEPVIPGEPVHPGDPTGPGDPFHPGDPFYPGDPLRQVNADFAAIDSLITAPRFHLTGDQQLILLPEVAALQTQAVGLLTRLIPQEPCAPISPGDRAVYVQVISQLRFQDSALLGFSTAVTLGDLSGRWEQATFNRLGRQLDFSSTRIADAVSRLSDVQAQDQLSGIFSDTALGVKQELGRMFTQQGPPIIPGEPL